MSSETSPTHLLIYTDGGCDPGRGYGGWGIHGYAISLEPATQGCGHPKAMPGPDGYIIGTGKPPVTTHWYVDNYGSLSNDSTNNIAELEAARGALRVAIEKQVPHVLLLMDSTYVMDGLDKYCWNWERNNWLKSDGQPVVNAQIWKDLHQMRKSLLEMNIKLSYKKVKGHSGDTGNDIVDTYATIAKEMGRNGHPRVVDPQYSPAKGYWSRTSSRNRFFNCGHWIFNADMTNGKSVDGRAVYHQTDLRTDLEYFGKPISDATFSVLFLKEEDKVLEDLRRVTYNLGNRNIFPVFSGWLREIFKPVMYDQLAQHGTAYLIHDFQRGRLFTADGSLTPVVTELRPPGLALRGCSNMNILERRLEDFLSPPEGSRLVATEITDKIFVKKGGEEDPKTKAVKKVTVDILPSITPTATTLAVEAGYHVAGAENGKTAIKLVLGQDIPDRATLKGMATPDIRAWVLTWPASENAIHYATVVESDGDIGIWCGVYSNLKLLR